MQPFERFTVVLAVSSILFLPGCSFNNVEGSPSQPQTIEENTTNQPSETNPFRDAVNKATEASNSAQSATTSEEWTRVADTWQQAISLMKAVPEVSENYETAQQKVVEYQTNFEYAQRNIETVAGAGQQVEESANQEPPISQKASHLRTGMAYRQVVALLGRMPDTVVDDQIRQELGEPVQGNSLITFEWKNNNSDCQPVSVDFNSSAMTVTGWNEGRTCTGSSIFNEPFGKPCSETILCKLE